MSNEKISDYKPQQRNANKHNQRGSGLLERSIRRDGWITAISVANDGEAFDGSLRLEKAADIFDEHVEPIVIETDGTRPVILKRTDIPNAEDPRAKRLALDANRIAEADLTWDVDVLQGLNDFDDLDLGDWFNDKELADIGVELEAPPEAPEAQIDRAAELREKWGVELGQLWRLGDHRLICGDCTDKAVVDRVMDGEKAGAVVTDPPYNIGKDGWDNIPDYVEWCKSWHDKLPNVPIYIFTGSLNSGLWWQVSPPRALYCWHKPNGQGNNPMRGTTKWEPILVWNPVQDKQTDFIEHNNEYGEKVNGLHLTPKPTGLIEKLVVKTIGAIYDPFLGSGTTLIACERLSRQCRAVEISPAYVAVALERWAEMTGETPELIADTVKDQ